MSYFSDFEIHNDVYPPDVSITPPKQQLLWRLDDLRNRLHALESSGASYDGCDYTHDLRYALPHCLKTIYDVKTAIELTMEDLANQYGIDASEKAYAANFVPMDNDTPEQLSLFEIVLLHPYCVQPSPA